MSVSDIETSMLEEYLDRFASIDPYPVAANQVDEPKDFLRALFSTPTQ